MQIVPRGLAAAVSLILAVAALAAVPALAADVMAGSKNFSAPAAVPNFFSNESGPMLGGKADSRVVDPPNVSAVAPPPAPSARAAAAAMPRYRPAPVAVASPPRYEPARATRHAAKSVGKSAAHRSYASKRHVHARYAVVSRSPSRAHGRTGGRYAAATRAKVRSGAHVVTVRATHGTHGTTRRAGKQATHRAG